MFTLNAIVELKTWVEDRVGDVLDESTTLSIERYRCRSRWESIKGQRSIDMIYYVRYTGVNIEKVNKSTKLQEQWGFNKAVYTGSPECEPFVSCSI